MNKRRKLLKVVLLCLLIIIIVIILLNWKGLFMNKGRKQEELVSKEDLIEWYGLTEEELEGIDLDKIMEKFTWRQSDLDIIDSKEKALYRLRDSQDFVDEEDARQKHIEEVSLEYLVTADEYEGELPDFNEIKYFAYSVQTELYINSYLFDFDKSIVYGYKGPIPVYIDYTVADTVAFLSEENKKEFINALNEANIESWKHRYGSKRKDTVWNIGMEFDDGAVMSYSGIAGKKGRPETYMDLYKSFTSVIRNSERDINTLAQLKYTDDEIYFDINLYEEEFSLGIDKRHIYKNGNLTEKEKEDIIQLMSNAKVHEWETFDTSIDDFEWRLELTYKDNYKACYGKNLGDKNNPQNYDEVINSIIDILNNHQE